MSHVLHGHYSGHRQASIDYVAAILVLLNSIVLLMESLGQPLSEGVFFQRKNTLYLYVPAYYNTWIGNHDK